MLLGSCGPSAQRSSPGGDTGAAAATSRAVKALSASEFLGSRLLTPSDVGPPFTEAGSPKVLNREAAASNPHAALLFSHPVAGSIACGSDPSSPAAQQIGNVVLASERPAGGTETMEETVFRFDKVADATTSIRVAADMLRKITVDGPTCAQHRLDGTEGGKYRFTQVAFGCDLGEGCVIWTESLIGCGVVRLEGSTGECASSNAMVASGNLLIHVSDTLIHEPGTPALAAASIAAKAVQRLKS